MGEVVACGLLAHVPTVMLPEEIRRELNNGRDFTVVEGFRRLRREVLSELDYDLVILFDSHWFTTVEFVITGHARRNGKYTSDELPRGMSQVPYDLPGDPEFAKAAAAAGRKHGTWITSIDDPCLPIQYATVNPATYLQRGQEAWVSVSCAQTGETEDFLRVGRALRDVIANLDRRVILLASGAMSHKFWPLQKLRDHEAAGIEHIFSPAHAAADLERLEWMKAGDHARILATMPEFLKFKPEANFGHYVMMAAAMGENDWTAPGRLFSEYENSIGTGQVHVWFDRPKSGWNAARRAAQAEQGRSQVREFRRILLAGAVVETERQGEELVARDGRHVAIADAVHLPPVVPTKVVCVHLNHVSRVHEFQIKLSATPTYFHKPISSLNAHRGDVVRPRRCKWLNYEGEVAIVIGKRCRNISQKEAGDYIAGYTVANDFGLHDFRDTDAGSMLRVKGSDTLCPLGPGLVTGWDFRNKYLRTYVNGQLKQDGNTSEMTWDMHYLVADIARNITLEPGDVLLSGTPANSRPVQPGDLVEVEVEGLGRLSNRIVEGPEPIREDVGAQPTESEEVLSTALGGDWEFRGIRPPKKPGA